MMDIIKSTPFGNPSPWFYGLRNLMGLLCVFLTVGIVLIIKVKLVQWQLMRVCECDWVGLINRVKLRIDRCRLSCWIQ